MVALGSSNPGQPMDHPRLVLRGEPERGYPIESTWRQTGHGEAIGITTSLVELSEAPLDQAIFDIPTAYRPALPLPGGGFDPSQPDSIGNRVESYWRLMTSWVSYWLR